MRPTLPRLRTIYDLFPSSLPLGPPPNGPFRIDPRPLRREFLLLQSRAHPDRHPDPADKARAALSSAHINHAYRTLSSPLLRAQYLLSLRGIDLAADDTSASPPPGLLSMVMRAHEEIDEARHAGDIETARRANDERLASCEESLGEAFKRDDVEAAKDEAVRLRYLVNIQTALDDWEDR